MTIQIVQYLIKPIIDKDKKFFLITRDNNAKKIIRERKIKKSQIINIKSLPNLINKLDGAKFVIDNKTCSIFFIKLLSQNLKIHLNIHNKYFKSIKNCFNGLQMYNS